MNIVSPIAPAVNLRRREVASLIRRLNLVLSVVALLMTSLTPAFAWKFVSMADSRGSTNGVNTAELTKIVNLAKLENADLVIFQGDAVSGSSNDTTLGSQMDTWLGIMNTLNCPWYYTVGNHEISTATSINVIRSKVNMPLNGPAGYEETAFSFDHENAHFTALDSDHYGEFHHVQRSWLTADLASTTKPHKFVMTHDPAYPLGPHIGSSLDVYPTERDDLWNIMTNAGVRMFFCGHEHFYARSLHGSIYQALNGSCGAPLYTATGAISKYHYVVVDVNGLNVSCQAKDDTGAVIDSWSYSVPPEQEVSIASIKQLPDGSPVSLSAKTVTAGANQLASTFYIEEEDRSSAIKVYGSGLSVADGTGVIVQGTLGTSNGERVINNPTVTPVALPYPVPGPVSMLTSYVSGGSLNVYTPGVTGNHSLNNTGLVVQVCGIVTYVNTTTKLFYVDDGCQLRDGSGQVGLQVYCGGRPVGNNLTMPGLNSAVTITGIASSRTSGGNIIPSLRPRSQSDIAEYLP